VLPYLLIFAAALTFAMAATPIARRVAVHSGVVALPNARRVHQRPTPMLGGVAIYAAAAAAVLAFGDRFYVPQIVGILVGASFVSFLGLWDDRRNLRPGVKLIGQIFAAFLLLLTGIQLQLFASQLVNVLVTVVWVVGVVNALNLVDNMDGLSGGIAAIASAFFLVLAASSGQYLVGSLTAALLGACLGFLYYNFNPASIFMGDSGSLFLGYVLAAVALKLKLEGLQGGSWLVPVLVLGLPLFDTSLVVTSRLRRGVSPLRGGKDHVSHRLVRMGWTHREAVMGLCLVSGALGVAALLVARATTSEAYTVGGIVGLIALGGLVMLERVRLDDDGAGTGA
jgi:UDP-GlcNAc:undecaprenyl-phosphate/decaprenyl-phosphate GlcNAc-1-phosphate transferase